MADPKQASSQSEQNNDGLVPKNADDRHNSPSEPGRHIIRRHPHRRSPEAKNDPLDVEASGPHASEVLTPGAAAPKPIIPNRLNWADHHPTHIDVIGAREQKNNTVKTLPIEGLPGLYSPKDAYSLAKTEGNVAASLAYAQHLISANPESFAKLIASHAGENPIIVPVDAYERGNTAGKAYNPIARSFAAILSDQTGWERDGVKSGVPIVQTNRVGRTGAPQIRFERNPTFEGPVEQGRNYIIVDDHFQNGGTARSLMDHIESNGGKVTGVSTLISGFLGTQLKPSADDIAAAKARLGESNYNEIHQQIFGVPGDHNRFTNGELGAFRFMENLLKNEHRKRNETIEPEALQNKLFERVSDELRTPRQGQAGREPSRGPDRGGNQTAPGGSHEGGQSDAANPGRTENQAGTKIAALETRPTDLSHTSSSKAAPVDMSAELPKPAPTVLPEAPVPNLASEAHLVAPVGAWNPRLMGLSNGLGTASVVVNLTDAAVKHDPIRAAEVAGTTGLAYGGMKVVAKIGGAEAVPVVGQAVGGVFAAKDAYDSAERGQTGRATVSGIEATLYTVSATAGTVALADSWNPTVIAPAAVSLIAGGAAVTITAAKGVYDNWNTITSWFGADAGDTSPVKQASVLPSAPLQRAARDYTQMKLTDTNLATKEQPSLLLPLPNVTAAPLNVLKASANQAPLLGPQIRYSSALAGG